MLRMMCRQVKTDEGRSVAQKLGASFIETSAKDNKNVRECNLPPCSIYFFLDGIHERVRWLI
jgi:hypothetical protein